MPLQRSRLPALAWTLVGAALTFHLVANIVWLSRYDVPPSWDIALHLTKSLTYSDLLVEGRLPELFDVDNYYPPLSRLPAALAHPFFGRGEAVAVTANYVWFVLLAFSVFGLGRRFGGADAGAAAALFASFTPFLYTHTRFYALVVPTTAATAAVMLALVYTDNLRRRGPSLAFGAVFGAAVLVKWTVAAFVLPPLMWACLVPDTGPPDRGRRLLHASAALAVTFFIASPWYLRHLLHFLRAARHTSVEAIAQGDPAVFTAASFTHYVSGGVYQMGIVLFAVAALALVYVTVRRRPEAGLLWFWVLGSYLILTLLRNKDYRFTAPLLPAFAVAFGLAFADLRPRAAKPIVATLGVAYALAAFFATSFSLPGLPPRLVWKPFHTRLIVYDDETPRREEWHLASVLDDVVSWGAREGRRPNLCVAPNTATFAEATFQYYARRDRRRVNLFRPRKDFPNYCDLIITKNGDQGDDGDTFRKLQTNALWFRNSYAVVRRYPLADGSRAALYRRRVRPRPGFAPTPSEILAVSEYAYPEILGDLRGATVDLKPAAPESGSYDSIRLRAAAATVTGVPVTGLNLFLEEVVIDPWAPEGEIHLLHLGSVALRFDVAPRDLGPKLMEAASQAEEITVRAEANGVKVNGRYKFIPFSAAATLEDDGRRVRLVLSEASLFGVPFPAPLLKYLSIQMEPLADRERLPFNLGPTALRRAGAGKIEISVMNE